MGEGGEALPPWAGERRHRTPYNELPEGVEPFYAQNEGIEAIEMTDLPAIQAAAVEEAEAGLDLDQLRSELKRIAEGRMTFDATELLTWAEGWLLTLHAALDQEDNDD